MAETELNGGNGGNGVTILRFHPHLRLLCFLRFLRLPPPPPGSSKSPFAACSFPFVDQNRRWSATVNLRSLRFHPFPPFSVCSTTADAAEIVSKPALLPKRIKMEYNGVLRRGLSPFLSVSFRLPPFLPFARQLPPTGGRHVVKSRRPPKRIETEYNGVLRRNHACSVSFLRLPFAGPNRRPAATNLRLLRFLRSQFCGQTYNRWPWRITSRQVCISRIRFLSAGMKSTHLFMQ